MYIRLFVSLLYVILSLGLSISALYHTLVCVDMYARYMMCVCACVIACVYEACQGVALALVHSLAQLKVCVKMKKHKSVASSFDSWFENHADRVDGLAATGGHLLISGTALGSLSAIMGPNCPLPLPRSILSRGIVGPSEIAKQMDLMFQRRGLDTPNRIGHSRIGQVRKPFTICAYTKTEVQELILDSLAAHIQAHLDANIDEVACLRDQKEPTWPQNDADLESACNFLKDIFASSYDLLTPISIDEVVDAIHLLVVKATGADVSKESLRDHIAPICHTFEPTSFLVKLVCRCDIMQEVMGTTLGKALRYFAFTDDLQWDRPPEYIEPNILQSVVQEMLRDRKTLNDVRLLLADGKVTEATVLCGAPKLSTTKSTKAKTRVRGEHRTAEENRQKMHESAILVMKTNANLKEHKTTQNTIRVDALGSFSAAESVPYKKLSPYLLTLDAAMDSYVGDMITKWRDDNRISGFSWVSDESPPASSRYSGLRFQITWVYIVVYDSLQQWDLPEFEFRMPIARRRFLCDVVNCPGKTGQSICMVS
jgi:hypothetical protein